MAIYQTFCQQNHSFSFVTVFKDMYVTSEIYLSYRTIVIIISIFFVLFFIGIYSSYLYDVIL